MTIDSSTRDKVILLRKQGKTRDDIVKTLSQSGSCSNIIRKHEQSLQSNATIIEQSSSLTQQPEADSTIITGIDMDNIDGSPVSSGVGQATKNNLSNSIIVPGMGFYLL